MGKDKYVARIQAGASFVHHSCPTDFERNQIVIQVIIVSKMRPPITYPKPQTCGGGNVT